MALPLEIRTQHCCGSLNNRALLDHEHPNYSSILDLHAKKIAAIQMKEMVCFQALVLWRRELQAQPRNGCM